MMMWGKAVGMDALWTSLATYSELAAHLRTQAENFAADLAISLTERDVVVDTAVRHGRPRDVILDEARDWKPDPIIVGAVAVRGIKRWLRTGLASYLVTHASCPVEIVIQT